MLAQHNGNQFLSLLNAHAVHKNKQGCAIVGRASPSWFADSMIRSVITSQSVKTSSCRHPPPRSLICNTSAQRRHLPSHRRRVAFPGVSWWPDSTPPLASSPARPLQRPTGERRGGAGWTSLEISTSPPPAHPNRAANCGAACFFWSHGDEQHI